MWWHLMKAKPEPFNDSIYNYYCSNVQPWHSELPEIHCLECCIKLSRIMAHITHWCCKHAESMEWNHTAKYKKISKIQINHWDILLLTNLGGYMTILSTAAFFPLSTALAGLAEPQENVSATCNQSMYKINLEFT